MSSFIFIAEGCSSLERAFLEAGTALGFQTWRRPNHLSLKTADVLICFPDEINQTKKITICDVEGKSCLALPEIEEKRVPELTLELVKFISIYLPREIVAFGGSDVAGEVGKTTETQIMRLFVKAFSHTELLHVEDLRVSPLPSLDVNRKNLLSPSSIESQGSGISRRLWRRKSGSFDNIVIKPDDEKKPSSPAVGINNSQVEYTSQEKVEVNGSADCTNLINKEVEKNHIPVGKQIPIGSSNVTQNPSGTLPAPPPRSQSP